MPPKDRKPIARIKPVVRRLQLGMFPTGGGDGGWHNDIRPRRLLDLIHKRAARANDGEPHHCT